MQKKKSKAIAFLLIKLGILLFMIFFDVIFATNLADIAAISIVGGADGPTTIYVAGQHSENLILNIILQMRFPIILILGILIICDILYLLFGKKIAKRLVVSITIYFLYSIVLFLWICFFCDVMPKMYMLYIITSILVILWIIFTILIVKKITRKYKTG